MEAAAGGQGKSRRGWGARITAKMARTVELADAVGADVIDEALGLAAMWGRFAEGDLAALCDHVTASRRGESRWVHESFSIQPGTGGWAALASR